MLRYDYYKPPTIREALELMERHRDAVYIAGGTDVMVLMRQKKLSPKALISLRNIEELIRKDGLAIGSGVTHQGDPEGRRRWRGASRPSTTPSAAWAPPR